MVLSFTGHSSMLQPLNFPHLVLCLCVRACAGTHMCACVCKMEVTAAGGMGNQVDNAQYVKSIYRGKWASNVLPKGFYYFS